jgi:tRNA threonylcarbamoyl adenosine modification protein YeaZ
MNSTQPLTLLAINGTYTTIEIALVQDKKTISASISHHHASTQLLPAIAQVCVSQNVLFHELTAIAVNVGPAPFTTLRSIISTINGAVYATQTPLIAVSGIEAFVREHIQKEYTHTVALLNAFCNEVYVAEYDQTDNVITTKCYSINYWIEQHMLFLQKNPHARVKYIGNGCVTYQKELAEQFGMHTIASENIPLVPSVAAISMSATKQWTEQQGIVEQCSPLYLKPYTPHRSLR